MCCNTSVQMMGGDKLYKEDLTKMTTSVVVSLHSIAIAGIPFMLWHAASNQAAEIIRHQRLPESDS